MLKFDKEPNLFPSRIHFVDTTPPMVLEAAKRTGLQIIETEANNNAAADSTSPVDGTIYVFTDFENNQMFNKIDKSKDTWILGPTALLELTENPDLQVRRQPTYCYSMYPFVFHIDCPGEVKLEIRTVRLLKWMGGRFVKEPNGHTTHMITTSTMADGYIYCSTFKVHIVLPDWVEYCWSHRFQPNFDVAASMNEFAILPLLGLHLSLEGFDSDKLKVLETQASMYGAVVISPEHVCCTHLVISDKTKNRQDMINIPRHIKYVVNEEWLKLSLEFGRRVYEDGYHCFSLKGIRYSIYAEKETNDKPSTRSTLDKTLPEVSQEVEEDIKRKFAFKELLLKERNYIHCLKLLLDVQRSATDLTVNGGPILSQLEANMMFGNLDKLVEIHEEIYERFQDVEINWWNEAITTKGIIEMKNVFLKQYKIYTNNFNESKKLMELCQAKNKRFRKLLKGYMKNTNKEHPKDILIRPIQRLCSLKLQIAEIKRHTRDNNPDKQVLSESISTIDDVLNSINNSLEVFEKHQNVLEIGQRQIKNCPPELITSHRAFIVKFLAQELVIEKNNDTQVGMHMAFFLFNDILEVTKLLVKPQEALEDSHRFNSLKKKPFEHVATFPLTMINNVIKFKSEEGEDDVHKIFGLSIKNAASTIHCFRFSEENPIRFENMLKMIADQLAEVDNVRAPEEFVVSVPLASVGLTNHPIVKKPDDDIFDWFKNIFKTKTVNTNTRRNKCAPRRSRSCGDITDLTCDL